MKPEHLTFAALLLALLSVLSSLVASERVTALVLAPRPVGVVAVPSAVPACGESAADLGNGALHCGPGARASYDRDAGLGYCRCAP